MNKLILYLFLIAGASINAMGLDLAEWDIPQTGRIVAFGDIHGAYDEFVVLMRQAEVIDLQNNWIGGTTHLVSTGDIFDRGPGSRQAADLLRKLQQQAPEQGGSVHVALGNHEGFLIEGEMGVVSDEEFAYYASSETEAQRDEMFKEYSTTQIKLGKEPTREIFNEDYPPGFTGKVNAHRMGSELGEWILSNPLVIKIGDTLFMHGGLSLLLEGRTLDDVNLDLKGEILEYQALIVSLTEQGILPFTLAAMERKAWIDLLLEEYKAANGEGAEPSWAADARRMYELEYGTAWLDEGPFFYYGSSVCHPYVESYDLEYFLTNWGAKRIVVGHVVTEERRVTSRMENKVFKIDTGMLASAYRGRASAVVISDGALSVIYAGEEGERQALIEKRITPGQPKDLSDERLEAFLLTAEIINSEVVGTEENAGFRLTLEQDGISLLAFYRTFDSHPDLQNEDIYNNSFNTSDRYIYDIAAYKLDRLLGLYKVPVSIERTVSGEKGLLQIWPEESINESDRVTLKNPIPRTSCTSERQYRLRDLFDVLISNQDRNLINTVWVGRSFDLAYLDHSQAFTNMNSRPEAFKQTIFAVSQMFREKLLSLNEVILNEVLGAYLHRDQITAILKRRDMIVREGYYISL